MNTVLEADAGAAVGTCVPRLLRTLDCDYAGHVSRLGRLPVLGAAELAELASQAGLTGRGGAAFPTGRKLASLLGGRAAVVVGNAAEGEPASSKDRVLLQRAPHLVLDGLLLAAQALDAVNTYLYGPDVLLRGPVRAALAQRPDAGDVRLVAAPDAFVSGQQTAVAAAVEGRPALPRSTPPQIYVKGVEGRPTLVQNVETLAHLALIVRFGPEWFRRVGTEEDSGTRLHTISGAVRAPGVYELPGGATLEQALAVAGGASESVQALLVGGYHGGWVPWDSSTRSLPLSRSALSAYDAAPGAGVIIALAADRCGLRVAADIAAYLASENAGQCGPCLNGLPLIAELLARLAAGDAAASQTRAELERLMRMVDGRGACTHPGGTVRQVRSALRTFSGEIDGHLSGRCSAGAASAKERAW